MKMMVEKPDFTEITPQLSSCSAAVTEQNKSGCECETTTGSPSNSNTPERVCIRAALLRIRDGLSTDLALDVQSDGHHPVEISLSNSGLRTAAENKREELNKSGWEQRADGQEVRKPASEMSTRRLQRHHHR